MGFCQDPFYRIQLPIHNVELGVRYNEDVAIKKTFSCASFDFQLDPVCGVDEAGAMHFLTGHKAQIDQKPKPIFGIELLQSHMLWFVFFFHKKNRLTCFQASLPSRPLLYSMLGEPFIVTETLLMSGNTYSSESFAPAV